MGKGTILGNGVKFQNKDFLFWLFSKTGMPPQGGKVSPIGNIRGKVINPGSHRTDVQFGCVLQCITQKVGGCSYTRAKWREGHGRSKNCYRVKTIYIHFYTARRMHYVSLVSVLGEIFVQCVLRGKTCYVMIYFCMRNVLMYVDQSQVRL